MDNKTIFWVLLGVAILLSLCLALMANAISSIVDSDFFREKVKEIKNRTKNNLPTVLILLAFLPLGAFAGNESGSSTFFEPSSGHIWLLVVIDFILIVLCIIAGNYMKDVMKILKDEKEKDFDESAEIDFAKILTDVVPIEEEDSILMDHEYDGIRELDNNLPPWWKYGFYLTILIAFVYFTYYHVMQSGSVSAKEYQEEMAEAKADLEEYNKFFTNKVNETNVTLKTDGASISAGKKLFGQYCQACHGNEGQGGIGPNLTDEYWLYGGSVKDVFSVIKFGAKNGMKSWQDELNPNDIQNTASFIISLKGSNPANPKAPQGDLFKE